MFRKLQQANFITRCTFGISLIALLIMFTFGINNFVQGRIIGGITALIVAVCFTFNAILSLRGKYSLYLNLLGVLPALILASITALVSLKGMGGYWSFLCVFAIYFVLPFRFAKNASWVFLLGVISTGWFALDVDVAIRFTVVLISITLFIYIFSREMAKTKTKLKRQAATDPLTNLLNRTKLNHYVTRAIQNYQSNAVLSTLCIIDIDNFKAINDSRGHEAGDSVLINLAAELKKIANDDNIVFRIGGEEFLLLLNNMKLRDSFLIAEAIREVVAASLFYNSAEAQSARQNDDAFQITVSIGIAQVNGKQSAQQWINDADQKLYLAKQQGRNQVAS